MKISKTILCLPLIAALTGCASVPEQPEPTPRVADKVVTALPSRSQIPETRGNEDLPIYDLTEEDKGEFAKIAKKYSLTVQILLKRNSQNHQFIEDYKEALNEVEQLRKEAEKESSEDSE